MTRTTATIVVSVFLVLAAAGPAVAAQETDAGPTEITECTTITEPGRYVLAGDIENSSAEECIRIEASDVVFDGNGYTIDGVQNETTFAAFRNASYGIAPNATAEPEDDATGLNETNVTTGTAVPDPSDPTWANTGIAVNASTPLSNVTVENVRLGGFFFGAYADEVSDTTFRDVTAIENGDGIDVYTSSDVTIEESDFAGNQWGVFAWNVTDSAVRTSNATDNVASGVYLQSSNGVLVENVTASGNEDTGIVMDRTNESVVVDSAASDNTFGIAAIISSRNNTIYRNAVTENGHAGIELFESDDNLLVANTVADTSGEDAYSALVGYAAGISVTNASDNLIVSTTARDNADWAYYSSATSTNNTALNFTIAPANLTVDFRGDGVALDAADDPPEPPEDYAGIGKYVNATNTGEDAGLLLIVNYDDADLGAVDEETLRLWEHEAGNWSPVDGATGVNTEENYVFGNVTDFSVFAPLGQPTANESATNESVGTGNESVGAGNASEAAENASVLADDESERADNESEGATNETEEADNETAPAIAGPATVGSGARSVTLLESESFAPRTGTAVAPAWRAPVTPVVG